MKIEREFPLSKESFACIQNIASYYGIDIREHMEDTIYAKLVRRVRDLQLSDFDAYCRRLKASQEEQKKFINLITNLTTYFFREKYHFNYLEQKFFPNILAKKNKIRIWSAGCSTGEEPYSTAIIINECIPDIKKYDIKILATDINTDALHIAETGVYTANQFNHVSLKRKQNWFHEVERDGVKSFKVKDSLKELIVFKKLNLLDSWPMKNKFDLIICRNVIIYFTPWARNEVLNKFNDFQNVGGILILGYAENLYSIAKHYRSVSKNIYEKII